VPLFNFGRTLLLVIGNLSLKCLKSFKSLPAQLVNAIPCNRLIYNARNGYGLSELLLADFKQALHRPDETAQLIRT